MQTATVSERRLPSGRSVVVRFGEEGEDLEVRSPEGDVEVRIELTDAGPVIRLCGARLELEAAAVAVRCREFDVRAEGPLRMSGGELRVKTEEDIHLNGGVIRLNC
jgi:hypothetical protein